MNKQTGNRLLSSSDPVPVEWVNQHIESPIALVCEHAGNAVPERLLNLGLTDEQMQEHTAIDIGAEATARHVAKMLSAPLLMQRYSRLVVDCNRPTEASDAIPEVSHGTQVPANKLLSEHQSKMRIDEIFAPYNDALTKLMEAPQRMFAFSIHSFTPSLNEHQRPWDIGLLHRHDTKTSMNLQRYFNSNFPELTIGLNQPYQIDDESDWFVPRHAERLGLNHSLIEIRNDLISTKTDQEQFATIIAQGIRHVSSRDNSL